MRDRAPRSRRRTAEESARFHAGGWDPIERIKEMEQDVQLGFISSSSAFFGMLRGHTLQGTFCDPIYGGNANMVGWDLIGYPGVRLSVIAAEQNMSTPAARNHKSAYDYLMFSKAGAA